MQNSSAETFSRSMQSCCTEPVLQTTVVTVGRLCSSFLHAVRHGGLTARGCCWRGSAESRPLPRLARGRRRPVPPAAPAPAFPSRTAAAPPATPRSPRWRRCKHRKIELSSCLSCSVCQRLSGGPAMLLAASRTGTTTLDSGTVRQPSDAAPTYFREAQGG